MQTKQSIITLVGAAILLLFALAVISFVPPAPTIHALAPSLQEETQPHITIDFNTYNATEEYGNSLYANLTFTNFQSMTCDKNDGGTHHTAFDDPCYFRSECTSVLLPVDASSAKEWGLVGTAIFPLFES